MSKPRNRYNTKPKPKKNEHLYGLILKADREAQQGVANEEGEKKEMLNGEKPKEKKTGRQISNRLSALKCRKRGELYVNFLEIEVATMESDCAQLEGELSKAKGEARELSEKIELIKASQWMANGQLVPEGDWKIICGITNHNGPNHAMLFNAENFEHVNILLNLLDVMKKWQEANRGLEEARKKLQEKLKASKDTNNQLAGVA